MHKAIKYFTDLQDNNYAYHVGDDFPREGLSVSPKRLAELSSDKNRRGVPVIEEVKLPFTEDDPVDVSEEAKPKPKRGKKKG